MEDSFGHLNISEDSTTPSNNATLDELPPELGTVILQTMPNFEALKALIHSSPLYHNLYLDKRKDILSAVFITDIGSDVLPDALALYKAHQIGFPADRKEKVLSFIAWYKSKRESPPTNKSESLDLDALEILAPIQCAVAQVAAEFCKSALAVHPVSGKSIDPDLRMSANERRRIYRALYRFEIFRALFNDPLNADIPEGVRHCFDWQDQNLLFLTAIYKPWEVEELACIYDFLIMRITEILRERRTELAKICAAHDFKSEHMRREHAGYVMTLGLTLLLKLLNAGSAKEKASILLWNTFHNEYFLRNALGEGPCDEVYYTDFYEAALEGIELKFEDDSVVDAPNAAWPWVAGNKWRVYSATVRHVRRL